MYLCDVCNTPFDRPVSHVENMAYDGGTIAYEEQMCPVCGSIYFSEVVSCPDCGNWMRKSDILCKSCRSDLLSRFTAFADQLTAAEEQQIDEWMDGDSISDRRKWK